MRLLAFCSLLFLGCYSFSQTSLPGHIKSITVFPADNKTYHSRMGDQLTEGLKSLFRTEAPNLRQINAGAHSEFYITLVDYQNKPSSFTSSGTVDQYKVSLVVNVEFLDKIKGESIYKKEGLIGTGIYDLDKGETEAGQGQVRALQDIQQLIISNALSSW